VRQDPAEIGSIAIECALSRVSGERQKAQERVTSTSLIVRSSTSPPRTSPTIRRRRSDDLRRAAQ
jgi:DNA-binding LacI/PurR family transcriptional regulator